MTVWKDGSCLWTTLPSRAKPDEAVILCQLWSCSPLSLRCCRRLILRGSGSNVGKAPGWSPSLAQSHVKKLEHREKLCLSIIFPEMERYVDWLQTGNLKDPTNSNILCLRYVAEIKQSNFYPLPQYLIEKLWESCSSPVNIITRKHLLTNSLFANSYDLFLCKVLTLISLI